MSEGPSGTPEPTPRRDDAPIPPRARSLRDRAGVPLRAWLSSARLFAGFTSGFRDRVHRFVVRAGFPPDWYLLPLAAAIGGAAGVVAQAYGRLVRFSEEFFFGRLAEHDLRGRHLWLILALPVLGGLLVGLIKSAFKLPLITHGIPEVIEAIAHRQGRLRVRSGVFTAINSAFTLGSGGSTGQEGPIVLIGSVVGSRIGRTFRVSRAHMDTLIGCGAAAGLAAIFNAPIAGVFLVLEVLLRDFSFKTFTPVIVAAVFGVAANQAVAGLIGGDPAYHGALFHLDPGATAYRFTLGEIPAYLLLGLACGVVGWAFSKTLVWSEEAWERLRGPRALKPMLGGLILGGLGLLLVSRYPFNRGVAYDPPAFFGNGYPVVEALLSHDAYAPGHWPQLTILFVASLVVLKAVGTSMTLGSGGSGGIFGPCLFIGAAFGGTFGLAVRGVGYFAEIGPAGYALAGMAGVLAAAVHCPLTAFLLVFEITRDYAVVLPVMLVSITATIAAQVLMRDSIYTAVLRDMGIRLGSRSDLTLLRRITVAEVPLTPAIVVGPHEPVQRLLDLARTADAADYVVCDAAGRYQGIVTGDDVRAALLQHEAIPLMIVEELTRRGLPTVARGEPLDAVLDKFAAHEVAGLAVVSEAGHVAGLITRSRLMRQYQQALTQHG